MSVTKVEQTANSFTGKSGKEYIIYPSLSTKRFQVFEQLQVEMQYGASLSGFRTEINDAYNLFNQMKFADGCTKLNNMLNGVDRIKNKQPHPVLIMCALFICPSDEDQGTWSEAEAADKVEDWCEIDVSFFLNCAGLMVRRFMSGSSIDSPSISQ